MTSDKMDNDATKIAKLNEFKEKVKNSNRYVKFWKNKDNLESLISQSIAKAVVRQDRPGWIRTSNFDIEKSHAEILRFQMNYWYYLKMNFLNIGLKSQLDFLQKLMKVGIWSFIHRMK